MELAINLSRWAPGTFLGSLATQDSASLVTLGAPQEFQPGKILIREGERATRVYVLLDGITKITGNTIDGKNILLDIRVGGELVGEMAALDDGPRSATVVAATHVLTRSITQAEFLCYLDGRPAAWREVARALSISLRLATEYQLTANVRAVRIRLARLLLHLTERCAVPCPGGERLGVPLNHGEIAEMIGSSQPDVQRAFAYLRSTGAVRTEYRTQVIADRRLLQQIADMADVDPGAARHA
jgi:CRP/FNR family transcriptional regulator, cyclic AMP receptor protein